jgi:hypothetical protein
VRLSPRSRAWAGRILAALMAASLLFTFWKQFSGR